MTEQEQRKKLMEELLQEYYIGNKNQMGIPGSGLIYHKVIDERDQLKEHQKTISFLQELLKNNPQFDESCKIEFINYGDTELVYVVTLPNNEKKTILVGQPSIPFNTVKIEYENLIRLSKNNPHLVVKPEGYFTNGVREAYITPYFNQARCIASIHGSYGIYVPEPNYHFERYSETDEYIITKLIIANLIRLYDYERKLALAECKIGGGDFIMEKSFDTIPHTEENALSRMHLIAARKLINIELSDYITLLKEEFKKITYYNTLNQRDYTTIVNIKNRTPMSSKAIEDGISLGLNLRKNHKFKSPPEV